MSYIGTKPTSSFGTATSQTFTGNNSLTEFTLNRRVSAPEDLEVFVSNVQQQPTESYTIGSNGLTLTFSEAPPSGQFYVVYRTEVTQSALDPNGARTNQANTFTQAQTFSGDLTVDTSTLKVDSTNNRVGIGTTSPSSPLHIVGDGNTGQLVYVGSSSAHQIYLGNTAGVSSVGTLTNHDFQLIRNGATKLTVTSAGATVTGVGTLGTLKIGSNVVGSTTDIELTDNAVIKASSSLNLNATSHNFYVHTSGASTGGTGSSTSVMGIDASGDVTVSRNEANGTVRLNLSNTGSNGSTEYSEIKFNSTAGGTQTSVIQHRNNYGLNIGTTTDHPVYFLQNNSNAMSIDTSGRIGIGRNPADYTEHADDLVIGGTSGNKGITIVGGDTGYSILNFNRASNTSTTPNGAIEYNHNDNQMYIKAGSSGTAHMYLMGNGEVQLPNGNLKLFAGRGIDFSSQNQSPVGDGTANPTTENEVLQYYEHGTFSPKPTASGCTFSYQGAGSAYGSGHYTRIGDMVFIDINLDSGAAVTGSTGNAVTIQNLPFSGNTGCTLNGGQYFYRRVSDSTYPFIACQQYGTAISFLQMPANGVWRDLPASQVSFVDHRWKIAGCYHIGSI